MKTDFKYPIVLVSILNLIACSGGNNDAGDISGAAGSAGNTDIAGAAGISGNAGSAGSEEIMLDVCSFSYTDPKFENNKNILSVISKTDNVLNPGSFAGIYSVEFDKNKADTFSVNYLPINDLASIYGYVMSDYDSVINYAYNKFSDPYQLGEYSILSYNYDIEDIVGYIGDPENNTYGISGAATNRPHIFVINFKEKYLENYNPKEGAGPWSKLDYCIERNTLVPVDNSYCETDIVHYKNCSYKLVMTDLYI